VLSEARFADRKITMNDSLWPAVDEEAGQRMIKTNGVELCTQAFGDPANPGVLLIMGATASMVRWPETLCRQLANSDLYVIRYDNRDTGASTSYPPYAPPYTTVDLAEDAVGILDAYGIERAHAFGHSMGGIITPVAAAPMAFGSGVEFMMVAVRRRSAWLIVKCWAMRHAAPSTASPHLHRRNLLLDNNVQRSFSMIITNGVLCSATRVPFGVRGTARADLREERHD
jgi:hypothetical protein